MLTLVPAIKAVWSLRGRRQRSAALPVPPGLDVSEFLRLARLSFVRLQAAWDAADLGTLERLTTGPMLADLREQLSARGGALNHTDVLDVQARLLAFEELREAFVASVEFTGLIREQADGDATEFRELWLLTRLKAQSGEAWQLAQVQALA
jgi:predicted lipid-binding transport protein (Tim44 family)